MPKYYKYLNEDGTTPMGYGVYDISTLPSKWYSVEGKLRACQNGLHVMRLEHLLDWSGPLLFEVEVGDEIIEHTDKCVVREMRFITPTEMTERRWRLFACDCAARALNGIEKPHPDSITAVEVSRRYADGKVTDNELALAQLAAWNVPWDTTADVAWETTASDATNTARATANNVAWVDKWGAEKEWQFDRLLRYMAGDDPEPVPLSGGEAMTHPGGRPPGVINKPMNRDAVRIARKYWRMWTRKPFPSMAEIGRRCGGISRQAVSQRLFPFQQGHGSWGGECPYAAHTVHAAVWLAGRAAGKRLFG